VATFCPRRCYTRVYGVSHNFMSSTTMLDIVELGFLLRDVYGIFETVRERVVV